MPRNQENRVTQLEIFLKDKKIEETSMSLPPVNGALIYAGKPGMKLKVVSVEKIGEIYRVDTVKPR